MVLWARWEGIHQKVDIIAGRVEISRPTVTEAVVRIPPDQTSENTLFELPRRTLLGNLDLCQKRSFSEHSSPPLPNNEFTLSKLFQNSYRNQSVDIWQH